MDNATFEQWIAGLSAERDARADKYHLILKEADDLVALTLKGHLIVEELITVSIKAFCHDVGQLRKANLRFSQRLHLLRALERFPVVPLEFWQAVSALNRLRNELAHNLEPDRVAELTSSFVGAVESASSTGTKFPEPHEGREALSQALHFLIGGLEVVAFWQQGVEALVVKRCSD